MTSGGYLLGQFFEPRQRGFGVFRADELVNRATPLPKADSSSLRQSNFLQGLAVLARYH